MGIGADVGLLRWGTASIEWSLNGVWKALNSDVGLWRWGSASIEWLLNGMWEALNYTLARWGGCASAQMLALCDGAVQVLSGY